MQIGSLFSGIGGLELGLERSGLGRTVWQCERDSYCREVLARHWPGVPCYEDVIGLDPPPADLICGGFPCQNLSPAGRREGLSGAKSGLWSEFRRIIGQVSPKWVVIENVYHGWRRWVPAVRRQLAELQYDSVSLRLAASDVGAPHRRARAFVVANTDRQLIRKLSRGWRGPRREGEAQPIIPSGWTGVPRVERAGDGIPHRVDRNRALGNAVVPQVAEVIGRYIMQSCAS